MSMPDYPKILETPHHFWFGPVDLGHAVQGDTKVEPLPGGYVKVTKTFVAKSYTCFDSDSFYDFAKPNSLDKQSKN